MGTITIAKLSNVQHVDWLEQLGTIELPKMKF